MTRRQVLAGLVAVGQLTLSACSSGNRRRPAAGPAGSPDLSDYSPSPAPIGLDAVIDLSHSTEVQDFGLARRRSNVLGVFHKATEGGDWRDPLYADRRSQALSAGLLWGAYHFGTHQYPGAVQAQQFLAAADPDQNTLLALDLELNERVPANTMQLTQAEEFVGYILSATGRLPLVYVHPTWAEGRVMGRAGRSLGGPITAGSLLAQCDLWLADYRAQPQMPSAWADKGWRFWQYAGDGGKQQGSNAGLTPVVGVGRCDRNLFAGDAVALYNYWNSAGVPAAPQPAPVPAAPPAPIQMQPIG